MGPGPNGYRPFSFFGRRGERDVTMRLLDASEVYDAENVPSKKELEPLSAHAVACQTRKKERRRLSRLGLTAAAGS